MESWIHSVINSGHSSISVLIAVFFLGMIGVVTCGCNYALFAVVAGYSGTLDSNGKTKNAIGSGLAFLMGSMLSMAVIGGIFGYAGGMVSASFGNYWKIAAGLICIFFGLFSLDILPFKLPAFKINAEKRKTGLLSAIIFGLTIGGVATAFNSCCNPIFPVILATSFVKGSMTWGLLTLSVFALGYALPLAAGMVGIRLGVGKLSSTVSRISKVVQYVAGILLVLMGFYFLLTI